MGARFRSWWQQIKIHPVATTLIALFVALSVLVIFGGYKFNWDWTGFNSPSKTLWDWLQLLGVLAVPVAVGFGAVWFTTRQSKVSDAENKDNQRETALQAYIDKISELLLKEHLDERTADGKLIPEYEQVRKIARVRTITVLNQLDARRIGYVFPFLREAGLMSKHPNESVVSLREANLRTVNWSQAFLYDANLSKTNLRRAILNGAILSGAILSEANLYQADLSEANLYQADLSKAFLYQADLSKTNLSGAKLVEADLKSTNLSGANLSGANLKDAKNITIEELEKQAESLQGATMPDGSIHE